MTPVTERVPVDVLMPVRDGAALIGQACGVISTQSRPPGRLLILDDGSRDGTFEAAEAARDRGAGGPVEIVVMRAPGGAGVAAARNLLLEASRGLVAWFDADDLWPTDAIERRLCCWTGLEAERRSRTILYGDYVLHPGGRIANGRTIRMPDRLELRGVASLDGAPRTIQLQTAFGTREAFLLGGGFDGMLRQSEDVDFMFRHLSAGGRFERVPGPPLAFYFQQHRGRDAAAVERAHDALIARWGSTIAMAGTDPALWRLEKRLRYTVFVHRAGGDSGAVTAILAEGCALRRDGRIRAALRRTVRALRAGGTAPPPRTLEDHRLRREAQERGRRLRLADAPGGVSIRFTAGDPVKLVLEWRSADGAPLAPTDAQIAVNADGEAVVSAHQIACAWIRGAAGLQIKGVARGQGASRHARIVRSTEGVFTLTA